MIQQENEMKELDFTLDGPRIDTRWPVTFAVPFARGELKEEKDLVVYNNEGEGIALQTRPTVYWPDGSIRWLLLDFITDMDRKDPGFRLGEGKPSEEKGLYIHERLNRITVENGSFRAVIPHNGPGLLSEVNFGGDTIIESGGTGGIMESAGRFHTQNSPYNIRVESEGPQHAVITSRGYFTSEGENIFRYEAGVHFYAGLPLIKIDYTVINECPKKEGRPLSEITLDFKLGTDAEGRFGKEKGKSLRQVSADEYELDGDTREGRYAGSIEAEDQLVGVMKDFWQRFPSSLDLEGNTLTFGLLSEQDGEGMLSVQGEAQSREIWLWCGEDGPDGI